MQRGGLGAAPAAPAGEEEEEDYMSEKFLKQQEAERRLTTVKKRPVPQAKQLPKKEAVRSALAADALIRCGRCLHSAAYCGDLIADCRRRRYWRRASPSTSTIRIRAFNC